MVGVKRSFDHDDEVMKKLQKKMVDGEGGTPTMRYVGWFIELYKSGGLEIRDHVGVHMGRHMGPICREDKREYIEKAFAREHNPLMMMRYTPDRTPQYEIGYGANRVRAFIEFVNDEFPIQVDNGDGKKKMIHFSELDKKTQNTFLLCTDMCLLQLRNISDEQFDDLIEQMTT